MTWSLARGCWSYRRFCHQCIDDSLIGTLFQLLTSQVQILYILSSRRIHRQYKFELLGCTSVTTPLELNVKLSEVDGVRLPDASYYRTLIGKPIRFIVNHRSATWFCISLDDSLLFLKTTCCSGNPCLTFSYIRGFEAVASSFNDESFFSSLFKLLSFASPQSTKSEVLKTWHLEASLCFAIHIVSLFVFDPLASWVFMYTKWRACLPRKTTLPFQ